MTAKDDSIEVVEIVARALCQHGELLCWETHTSDAARAIAAIEASGRRIVLAEATPTEAIEKALYALGTNEYRERLEITNQWRKNAQEAVNHLRAAKKRASLSQIDTA